MLHGEKNPSTLTLYKIMFNTTNELNKIFKSTYFDLSLFRPISSAGVVLYGAGKMGSMALDLMNTVHVKPKYIVDKNYDGELGGVKVIKPDKLPELDLIEATFVICIATIPVEPIFHYLKKLGCKDVRHFYDYSEITFPNVMPNGWFITELTDKDKAGIEKTCSALAHDDKSLAHYLQFLWWRLKRKEVLYDGYPVLSGSKYFKSPAMPKLTNHECLLDGGAYSGKTIKDFIAEVDGRFDGIWAFEPDKHNMDMIKKSIGIGAEIYPRPEALAEKCKTASFQDGLGYASKLNNNGEHQVTAITIDSLPEINPTIIKLHIEGNELNALKGARKTIQKHHPIIMVMADHSSDGLYKIPEFLDQFGVYKLYFNLHDYTGNSAVYYAIPVERLSRRK